MTDNVSEELWHAFMLAWEAAPDGEVVLQARFALKAVAPMLILQGMREAAEILTESLKDCALARKNQGLVGSEINAYESALTQSIEAILARVTGA